jgi:16S rRNA (cytidine1402-2'-O)-methyltransferase
MPRRPDSEPGGGTLYVVATPIGNLSDLSGRAAEVLRTVAVVAAEDTRETAKLLRHVGSSARLMSAHAHSPAARFEQIVALLLTGQDVAVCSDAGTPGVSDPGPLLVERAREAGVRVVPIPGPSAVHAALSVAGFPADRYWFAGFPPRRGDDRLRWLERVARSEDTVVCFEAPGRVGRTLADLARTAGSERRAIVGRELTKAFEEVRFGALEALAAGFADEQVRGECTLVIEGAGEPAATGQPDLAARLARALRAAGMEPSRAARVIAAVAGTSRNESYRVAMESGE